MSALFFKVSLPENVARLRKLQKEAKKVGRTLVVKNMSRSRSMPIFLFYLSRPEHPDLPLSFANLDDVEDLIVHAHSGVEVAA